MSSPDTSLRVEFTELLKPQFAPVCLDGKPVGSMGQHITIEPGQHAVRVGQPPFCSSIVEMIASPGEHLLFSCQRSALAKTASVVGLATISLILGMLSKDGRILRPELVVLAIVGVAIGIAFWRGANWLSLRRSPLPGEAATVRVSDRGTRIRSGSLPPVIYVDGHRVGRVGEAFFVIPGTHKVRVAGWTVSSNELAFNCGPEDKLEFACKESQAAWVIAAAMLAAVISAFAGMMWIFNRYDGEPAMEFFMGFIVLSVVFCSLINRVVPTMKISPGTGSDRGATEDSTEVRD